MRNFGGQQDSNVLPLLKRSLLIGLLALFGVIAVPAISQETTPPAQQEEEKTKAEQAQEQQPVAGEEIVVTARKREENVQEVPVAVTVVTADKLEEAAAADISELQTQVPNLSVYQGRNQSTTLTAFMRGIGQADPLWGVDPGVGIYLDDVYIARPQGALLDVYDVERIEVLRGPQGTLYGKNTLAGAIKYVTRDIVTDDPAFNVTATGGSYDQRDIKIGGSAPI